MQACANEKIARDTINRCKPEARFAQADGAGKESMRVKKHSWLNAVTAGVLVLALLAPQKGWSFAEKPPENQTQQPQPDVVDCNAVAVGLVLGIAAGGLYIIWRLCKLLPPPQKPAPPPPPPPPLTNPPPPLKTNGPVKVFFKMDGPPTPPQPTNNTPCTNCPPPPPPHLTYWLPGAWQTNTTWLTNVMSNMLAYDISTNGYMDTNSGVATNFVKYIAGAITNLASSTDLVNWSNYTAQAWVSMLGTEVVLYDGQGNGVYSGYATNSPYPGVTTGVATNKFPLGVWVGGTGTQEFHKAILH
jgi:hypothetical protein